MTKIIWVRGGLVSNDRLAAAIDQIPERECLIVKVESVQEAIVELYEGEGETALIICDSELEMSIPQSELHYIAERQNIPYLTNEKDGVYTESTLGVCEAVEPKRSMYETQRFTLKKSAFISNFLGNLHIHHMDKQFAAEHLQAL
jgi:hypothetical protein